MATIFLQSVGYGVHNCSVPHHQRRRDSLRQGKLLRNREGERKERERRKRGMRRESDVHFLGVCPVQKCRLHAHLRRKHVRVVGADAEGERQQGRIHLPSQKGRTKNKRKSLYGPASKTMVLYMMGMVPLGMRLTMGIASTIATGLCIGECTYATCLYCPP